MTRIYRLIFAGLLAWASVATAMAQDRDVKGSSRVIRVLASRDMTGRSTTNFGFHSEAFTVGS